MQQEATFTITIEAQEIQVHYRPRRFAHYSHLEFMSLHSPRRRIPLSKTGYLSHFSPMHEIEAALSVEAYAEALAIALLDIKSSSDEKEEPYEQLVLFSS
jgi:hypothetical protein